MTGQIWKTAAKDALNQLQEEGLVLTEEATKRYKLGTEMGREKGEIEEKICTVLEVYGYVGSRTEYIFGKLSSIKILHCP